MDYAKAIELNPGEPVYYQNLATTVYLFRKDAMAFYSINEQQVFDKALALYRKAIQLSPGDFPLAPITRKLITASARSAPMTRSGLGRTRSKSPTTKTNARAFILHLARIKMSVGRFAEARAHLNDVTNAAFAGLKHRLENNLAERESATTNPIAAGMSTKVPVIAVKTNLTPAHSRSVLSNASPGAHQSAAFCPVNGCGPDQCSARSSPRYPPAVALKSSANSTFVPVFFCANVTAA